MSWKKPLVLGMLSAGGQKCVPGGAAEIDKGVWKVGSLKEETSRRSSFKGGKSHEWSQAELSDMLN